MFIFQKAYESGLDSGIQILVFCSKIFQFPGIVTLWALLFFGSGSSGPSSADSNCGGHSQEKKVKDWPKMMDPRTN